MLKNSTYKEKFAMLKSWMPSLVDDVKKDIKNEHLKNDWMFVKKYLGGKNLNKVTNEDIAEAYTAAVAEEESAEEIGEFLSNRWLLKHGDIYQYFEAKLSAIDPNFSDLDVIDKSKAQDIVDGSVKQFGPVNTYLFSVLNSVVFPKDVYEALNRKAEDSARHKSEEMQAKQSHDSHEAMQRAHDQHVARLTDKYEKKLSGLQKKYVQDVETLKKQISLLTKKLNG